MEIGSTASVVSYRLGMWGSWSGYIQNTQGQLLQSFTIDPKQIRINWYRPDAPGKTKAGESGPLNLLAESKAQVLLMALVSLVPTEFAGAQVVTFAKALNLVGEHTS